MDRINELLAKLQELTPDELTELDGLINARYDEVSGSDAPATADSVAEMNTLIEGLSSVRARVRELDAEAAQAEQDREDARARMEAIRNGEAEEAAQEPTEGEQAQEGTPADPNAEDGSGEAEGEPAPSPIGEPVAAATEPVVAAGPRGQNVGSHVARMAQAQGRTTGSPERGAGQEPEFNVIVTAAAGLPNVPAGGTFENPEQLATAMAEKLERMRMSRDRSEALIASARWEYADEDRILRDGDEKGNTRKIDKVCGINTPRYDRQSGALVATGGICLPTNVDYSVPTWVSTDRPLRDALPAFQATRGGIQFVTPPDIGTVSNQGTASGSGLATSVWTEATDASPGSSTKSVWQVTCGSPQQVYVDAVPTRVEFGNMLSRFAPEQVAANTEQAIAAAAREAELNLLQKMFTASNQVAASQFLGATRDILASVDIITSQYRYSHRYARNLGLTAVFPEWAMDVMKADLLREQAHDNAGSQNVLSITDAQIEGFFRDRGIEVIWTMDALKSGTYGTGGNSIPNQFFPKVTAGAAPLWPGQSSGATFTLAWLLFVTGTFQFLDGGRLDLGVVRDSVLDATNDYETFVEPFEGIAFRGNEVLQVQSVIKPTGASGLPITGTYAE